MAKSKVVTALDKKGKEHYFSMSKIKETTPEAPLLKKGVKKDGV